jgi:hypothetical protein
MNILLKQIICVLSIILLCYGLFILIFDEYNYLSSNKLFTYSKTSKPILLQKKTCETNQCHPCSASRKFSNTYDEILNRLDLIEIRERFANIDIENTVYKIFFKYW